MPKPVDQMTKAEIEEALLESENEELQAELDWIEERETWESEYASRTTSGGRRGFDTPPPPPVI